MSRRRRRHPAPIRDADGIRWLLTRRYERRNPDELAFWYGRCRSGKRWLWTAGDLEHTTQGWCDDEASAIDAARQAVLRMANGRPSRAIFRPGEAYAKLSALNLAKRKARPSSASKETALAEYLYSARSYFSEQSCDYEISIRRHRIFKRTAKRIFFDREGEWINENGEPNFPSHSFTPDGRKVAAVDRQKMEADDEAENGTGWDSNTFYASLEMILTQHRERNAEPVIDIAALKQAMADAHPDRGGTNAVFIEARKKYVEAKRAAGER